jgi:hypothetical protein
VPQCSTARSPLVWRVPVIAFDAAQCTCASITARWDWIWAWVWVLCDVEDVLALCRVPEFQTGQSGGHAQPQQLTRCDARLP